jgi:hypothetical protein
VILQITLYTNEYLLASVLGKNAVIWEGEKASEKRSKKRKNNA